MGRSANLCVVLSLALLLGIAGAACHHPPSLSGEWRITPHQVHGRSLSRRVVLIADNQFHHLYGDPGWIRSGLTNQVVFVLVVSYLF